MYGVKVPQTVPYTTARALFGKTKNRLRFLADVATFVASLGFWGLNRPNYITHMFFCFAGNKTFIVLRVFCAVRCAEKNAVIVAKQNSCFVCKGMNNSRNRNRKQAL